MTIYGEDAAGMAMRDGLLQKRNELWQKMRAKLPRDFRELDSYDYILQNMESDNSGDTGPVDYAKIQGPGPALAAYVRVNGPTHKDVVIDALVAAGWNADHPNPKQLLQTAIGNQMRYVKNPVVALRDGDILYALPVRRAARKAGRGPKLVENINREPDALPE